MGRIMAIDYGQRRTGVAVSDPAKIIAGGLDTVETPRLLEFIAKYMEREPVERIVVGKPTTMSGQPSENAARVNEFVKALKRRVGVPVELYDERFTSVMAHRAMIDGGLRKMERRDKALVDKISATIILQSYMERIKR